MDLGFSTIQGLAKLLNVEHQDDSDSDNESRSPSANRGPGSVGPPKKHVVKSPASENVQGQGDGKEKRNDKDIWTKEEVEYKSQGATFDLANDPREKPNFETFYRQAVTTEDIYLQMGGKTPCSASCENYVVVIDLPGENFKQVKLDIKTNLLILRSPQYIFRLDLPHPVDPNAGSAKWDSDKEKLTVTLKLSRELDALNF